jgi:tetratricopeptide (TPR) repeat protein
MTRWIRVDSLLGMCIFVALSSGCRTTTPPPDSSGSLPDYQLNTADIRQRDAFAHFMAAEVLADDPDKTDRAIDEYLLAAEADPTNDLFYSSAAQAAIRDLDVPHAVEILQKNVTANPHRMEAHMELGAVYQLQGDRTEAIGEFEKAMELAPTNMASYLYLADLHFANAHDDKALAVLTRGVKRIPSAKPILGAYVYRAAKAMLDDQQFSRAIPCLEFVAMTMDEKGGLVHQLIGELCEAQKDVPKALSHYRLAAEASPPIPDAIVKVALSFMPERPDKAIAYLEKALPKAEDTDKILFALALIQREAQHIPECISNFEQLRLKHPQTNSPLSESFYLNYADTCESAGMTNKTEEILLECITLHPSSHQAMNYLAFIWSEQGVKLDKALSYIKQALLDEPDNGAYLDTLGWIYFKQASYDKAMEALLKADRILEDSVIKEHLGDVFFALGKVDQAIEQWKRSRALDPSSVSVQSKLAAHPSTSASAEPAGTNTVTEQKEP